MRLTTHLMQIASWLLVQRALRDGNMTLAEASDPKYRFTGRDVREPGAFLGVEDLPGDLHGLMVRSDGLYERVKRLDNKMYGADESEADANGVALQVGRLQAAFDAGAFGR